MRNVKLSLLFIVMIVSLQGMATDKWTNYFVGNTVGSTQISTIAEDTSGVKWIASYDMGVYTYDGKLWKNYTTSDGLLSNAVNAVAIDPSGVKWFGTNVGVNTFDGTIWKRYTKTDGLLSNTVMVIAIDKTGVKWFGGRGGMSSFDGTTWTTHSLGTGIPVSFVGGMIVDKYNNKWFASNRGIYKFDNTSWVKYSMADGLPDSNCSAIATDKQNNIWVGSDRGLSVYNGTSWHTYTHSDGLVCDTVYSIYADTVSNKIYAGTTQGLSVFDGTSWQSYTSQNSTIANAVMNICKLKDNSYWFASYGKGIAVLDGNNWSEYTTASAPVSNNISCAVIDKSGEKWFAYSGNKATADNGGLMKYDGNKWTSYTKTEGLVTSDINYIAVDNANNKWLATTNSRYLIRFDGTNWSNFKHNGGLLACLHIDRFDNIWIGGFLPRSGVNLLKYNGIQFEPYPGILNVSSIKSESPNTLWYATWGNGVYKYDGTDWKHYTTADGLASDTIWDIFIDEKGAKWMATSKGITSYNGVEWKTYTTADGVAGYDVYSIASDVNGVKWFATTSSGVSRFDGTTWKTYTTKDGLANDSLASVFIDEKGRKWFSTSRHGISVLDDGSNAPGYYPGRTKIGQVFNDLNGNGTKDNGETNLPEQILKVNDNFTVTHTNGLFYIPLNSENYTVSIQPQNYWKATSDTVLSFVASSTALTDTLFFGLKAEQNIDDVSVSISGTPTRIGFTGQYWVDYKNTGSINENGTVSIELDDLTTIIKTTPEATLIEGNKVTWDFTDLLPQENRQIQICAQMADYKHLGDTIINKANVTISNTDVNLSNNACTLKQILTGSFDPNDKQVAQGEGTKSYVLHNSLLEYTIHFQNTGTDTAYNVNVADTINANMDLSTLQIISSSHTVSLELKDNNVVVFHFENILLPDSTKNKSGSQGFVKYSIKPKTGLTDDTEVSNKADIYFDYNPAVITNTVNNTFVTAIPKGTIDAVKTVSDNQLSIYPNPATDGFYVITSIKTSVTVFSLSGQELLTKNILSDKYININSLPKGMYIVKLVTENGITEQKVIKQ